MGMAGPAMIEGGGLGVFKPEEVGPVSVQTANGVIDVLVNDEAEAVAVAKQYLAYFQGRVSGWSCADQHRLRHIVPENRLRGYDMRKLIRTLADDDLVLELRAGFGFGMITALIRVEGRPLGVIANNPLHLGGAVDSDAADKAARFMQLCDAHDIPLLSLNDNPGNMVGPEAEKTALIRHCCRSYLVGANLSTPVFFVCIRKSYGLGKLAMIGGGMRVGVFAIAWPTGEFGGMGLEGQVKLGRRKELQAIADPAERRAAYDQMVAELYEKGRAINQATEFGVDDVIDPAETRRWIVAGLRSLPPTPARTGKSGPASTAGEPARTGRCLTEGGWHVRFLHRKPRLKPLNKLRECHNESLAHQRPGRAAGVDHRRGRGANTKTGHRQPDDRLRRRGDDARSGEILRRRGSVFLRPDLRAACPP